MSDSLFSVGEYPDRNVVLYKFNNSAWARLRHKSPVQVENGKVQMGASELSGAEWGTYFIVPHPDSDLAIIGVVTATGSEGMKAIYANHYLLNGTAFPDLMLFESSVLQVGVDAIKCAGFFGNDWSVESGDFEWR